MTHWPAICVAPASNVTLGGARSAVALPAAFRLLRAVNGLRPRVLQGWMYHGNLAASFAHALCPGRRGRKLFWNLRASNMDAQRYGRLIRLSALLSRRVDVVVANSQAGVDFHRAHGFRPKRFELIANGIDIEKFHPDAAARREVRAELGIADDAVVVLHVARVDAMKDHGNFLAAMAQLPSSHRRHGRRRHAMTWPRRPMCARLAPAATSRGSMPPAISSPRARPSAKAFPM